MYIYIYICVCRYMYIYVYILIAVARIHWNSKMYTHTNKQVRHDGNTNIQCICIYIRIDIDIFIHTHTQASQAHLQSCDVTRQSCACCDATRQSMYYSMYLMYYCCNTGYIWCNTVVTSHDKVVPKGALLLLNVTRQSCARGGTATAEHHTSKLCLARQLQSCDCLTPAERVLLLSLWQNIVSFRGLFCKRDPSL